MSHLDASGRISERSIMRALAWQPGDRLTINVKARLVVIHTDPRGLHTLHTKRCVALPARARAQCGLRAGDQVLLAAAPDHGVLIVHTLAALDAMIIHYHNTSQHNPADMNDCGK
ncbi:AbrB/MazE/SpoVT family DNA-binding domain-containing protein [Saccharopolyspora phatthalungensis]|uniref:Bifunctional DNA-binding transcriptional regulator/antitoxin component of YhaV-PrlF toxin-antitoxin module n=1 Tax=Saccharopolyspora phatthalungensis TaxID=664693 RepID=A0A840QFX8_9PSEU|nr:AbrB/MazE/SpoVT family DNA-binding domain-containing protein [Saccharopolyspora phatthalungensis]MBB5157395.1 bifunctional DNA-binding transcriptional regulator/antitoxin component of YhaV-PrlF toxin-antitoxin module [Saccharopolyspora phatthalungensis]